MKTLEELKAAWEALVAELAKDAENAELKAKVEAAKAAYDAKAAEDPENVLDGLTPEQLKEHIAKLRKENGSHRTKSKDLASRLATSEAQKKAILKAAGIETEDDKPEEKVKLLSSQNQQLVFDKAVVESALENGIPASQLKYYKFLLAEATNELGEGEELSDEALEAIVANVKKLGGGTEGSGKKNTSVGGKEKEPPANNGGTKEVTFEHFLAMGPIARSNLYTKNREQYEAFYAEAKAKKKLV
jgi:hypothetical protein